MAIKISGNTVIDDSRNITSSGTMSANAYIGDGSQLTNLPGGGNVLEATASGTLADGDTTIVNTDGTVSAVAQSAVGWVASVGTSGNEAPNDIEVDSSGNAHIVGRTASYDKAFVLKLNSSAAIQWERNIGTNSNEYNAVATDSSGNVYAAGRTQEAGQGGYDWLIAKYNSSGTEQWQITFGTNMIHSEPAQGIDVDSSGNVYVSGAYVSGVAQSG